MLSHLEDCSIKPAFVFYDEQMVRFSLDVNAVSAVLLKRPHIVLCDLCCEIASKDLLSLVDCSACHSSSDQEAYERKGSQSENSTSILSNHTHLHTQFQNMGVFIKVVSVLLSH